MDFQSTSALKKIAVNRRYYTLDGMRGVAAVIVVFGHAGTLFEPMPPPRMWLAVDLFFILSGFVLNAAYANRFENGMTARQFMLQRYIRLYPLWFVGLTVGTVSATVAFLLGKGSANLGELATGVLSGLLLLPTPAPFGVGDVMPINSPGWSLFFELVANLFFVLIYFRLTNRVLVSIVALCLLALTIELFLGAESGGDRWHRFWWGFPRVGFSFFPGVLLHRLHRAGRVATLWSWLIPLSLIPLMWGEPSHGLVVNYLLITVAFPVLVLVGATFEPRSTGLFAAAGTVSYAIYAVHEPILSILWRGILFIGRDPEQMAPAIGVFYCTGLIAVCFALDRYYDEPIRKYLSGLMISRGDPSLLRGNASNT